LLIQPSKSLQARFSDIIIEDDSLSIISKLSNKSSVHSVLGFFISKILCNAVSFSFHAWSCVKRGGSWVAHEAAHLEPYDPSPRIWAEDVPMSLIDLASKDMYIYLNDSLI